MTDSETFDAHWWEHRYASHHQPAAVGHSPVLEAETAHLSPGLALDAGCGDGANAVWLAEQGWTVTGIDVSPTAVSRAAELARRKGVQAAFVARDLTEGAGEQAFDLVTSHYVHPAGPYADLVRTLASAVAAGGTLLVAAHAPGDEVSGAHAPGHVAVTPGEIVEALGDGWLVEVAEVRTRLARHGDREVELRDTVVRARRPE